VKRSVNRLFYIAIPVLLILIIFFSYTFIREKVLKGLVYPLKYTELVNQYADENELDRSLVYAVIKCESSFKPDAKSGIGARGLMQITPETFTWAQTKRYPNDKLPADELYKPETNIKFGTFILAMHLREFQNKEAAIAAYHAGRGKVNEWLKNKAYSDDGINLKTIPTTDTAQYVKRVINTQKTYTNLYKEVFQNE